MACLGRIFELAGGLGLFSEYESPLGGRVLFVVWLGTLWVHGLLLVVQGLDFWPFEWPLDGWVIIGSDPYKWIGVGFVVNVVF